MAVTVVEKVASYLTNLTSTSALVSTFGSTFTYGTNLFTIVEPDVTATNIVTLIPYGGSPPDGRDLNKFQSSFQIRTKTRSRLTGLHVQQEFINKLHTSTNVASQCKIFANNSTPVVLGLLEGGKSILIVTNYTTKHIKF